MAVMIFERRELKPRGFIDRLLRREPKENALAKIVNLLADSMVLDVQLADVHRIAPQHKVDFERSFTEDREQIYRAFAQHCLVDGLLSDDEVAALDHLRLLLHIPTDRAHEIATAVAQAHYKTAVRAALQDSQVSDDERSFLDRLRDQLRLSEDAARSVYGESAQAILKQTLNSAISDGRLSHHEEERFWQLARHLGVKVDLDAKTREAMQRMKLYWLYESGTPPTIEVGLALQRGEVAYFQQQGVQWFEHRKITTAVRYAGPQARIKIAKGLYFRVGQVSAQRVTEDVLKHIDTGTLTLTNKRIIFQGREKNVTIQLKKVLAFEPFSNGVDIQKDSGKSPFVKMATNIDIFSLALDRAIRDIAA